MATISNTGKTVTLFMSTEESALFAKGDKFSLDYDSKKNAVVLKADVKGLALCQQGGENGQLYLTFPSKQKPSFPAFGRIRAPMIAVDRKTMALPLPPALPEPKLMKRRGKSEEVENTANNQELVVADNQPEQQTPSNNLMVIYKGQEYNFHVPEDDLPMMMLDFAKKGYMSLG